MGLVQQLDAVLFDGNDVGMVIGYADHGLMLTGPARQTNVQHARGLGAGNFDLGAVQIGLDRSLVLFCYIGNDLQLGTRIARHDTHGDRCINASAPTGIGHHNGFHVFQDIAADLSQHFFRFNAQHLTQLCSTVRDSDGLCTPGSQDEFFIQNGEIGRHFLFVQHRYILLDF